MSNGAISDCSSMLKWDMRASCSADALARDTCVLSCNFLLCFVFSIFILYVFVDYYACLNRFSFVVAIYSSLLNVTHTPFTRWENAYIFMRFGLSFTRKRRFYHEKRSFLKTPAKVEISESSVFVFACELVQTEFRFSNVTVSD